MAREASEVPARRHRPLLLLGLAGAVLLALSVAAGHLVSRVVNRPNAKAATKKDSPDKKPSEADLDEAGPGDSDSSDVSALNGLAPPLPPALPIEPPHLPEGKLTVRLPGTVVASCAGGGGRYLVFHLEKDQLAVFDVSKAKVAYTLDVPSGARAVAGMHALVVIDSDKRTIQRHDLATGKPLATGAVPGNEPVTAAAMGSASDGPLALMLGGGGRWQRGGDCGGKCAFIDLLSLERIAAPVKGDLGFFGREMHLRFSADGGLLAMWSTSGSPEGVYVWLLSSAGVEAHHEHTTSGNLIPAPDGSVVYSWGEWYGRSAKPIAGTERGIQLPATSGGLVFCLDAPSRLPARGKEQKGTATLCHAGNDRPLSTLDDVEGVWPGIAEGRHGHDGRWLPPEQRFYLVPQAKLLASLSVTKDSLHLRRLDLDEELTRADVDYLFVTSRPPTTAVAGRPFAYQASARSKKGPIRFRLQKGPNGASVSESGRLIWDVPPDHSAGDVVLEVVAKDATGLEVVHAFAVQVRTAEFPPRRGRPGKKEAAVPVEVAAWDGRTSLAPGIRPADLEGDEKVVDLPAAAGGICAGGAGRYLAVHLPSRKEIALFDVCTTEFVRYVPCAEGVRFTAGADDLFLTVPKTNKVERWSLSDGRKVGTSELPVVGRVRSLSMGAATRGPLLTAIGPAPAQGPARDAPKAGKSSPSRAWLMLWQAPSLRPTSLKLNGETDETVVVLQGEAEPYLTADGRRLICPGGQTFRREGDQFRAEIDEGFGPVRRLAAWQVEDDNRRILRRTVAAQHGPFAVALRASEEEGKGGAAAEATLHLAGRADWSVVLPKPLAIAAPKANAAIAAESVFLIPAADLLVSVPPQRDKLRLQRLRLRERLKGGRGEDLFFAGHQPPDAVRGRTYRIPLAVCSRRERVSVTLAAAPKGMRLTPEGELVWNVPRQFAAAEVKVTLTARAGEESASHSFDVCVLAPLNDSD